MTTHVVLPGSGSAGLAWERAAGQLDNAIVMPLPDVADVYEITQALEPNLRHIAGPIVVVGSSLGALVAVELARRTAVERLVLVAAGFGIPISAAALDRIRADPPDLLASMARAVVAAPYQEAVVELIQRDFETRGPDVLLRHMEALAKYRPHALDDPPPTAVLWGTRDPGVPLEGHAELAVRCRGVLIPISDAGHFPYLEQTAATVGWIRATDRWLD